MPTAKRLSTMKSQRPCEHRAWLSSLLRLIWARTTASEVEAHRRWCYDIYFVTSVLYHSKVRWPSGLRRQLKVSNLKSLVRKGASSNLVLINIASVPPTVVLFCHSAVDRSFPVCWSVRSKAAALLRFSLDYQIARPSGPSQVPISIPKHLIVGLKISHKANREKDD